jgi:pyruvate/2-oxoglutarate/acetoin dehydrogenase E1 component
VRKTSRVVVAHEANETGGFGGEIVSRIVERSFSDLDAPPTRVGSPDVRFPASPVLQDALLPSADSIAAAALELVLG